MERSRFWTMVHRVLAATVVTTAGGLPAAGAQALQCYYGPSSSSTGLNTQGIMEPTEHAVCTVIAARNAVRLANGGTCRLIIRSFTGQIVPRSGGRNALCVMESDVEEVYTGGNSCRHEQQVGLVPHDGVGGPTPCSNEIRLSGPDSTHALPAGPELQMVATVRNGGSPEKGAGVTISMPSGPVSGITDANGEFRFIYTPPTLRAAQETVVGTCGGCVLPATKVVEVRACSTCSP